MGRGRGLKRVSAAARGSSSGRSGSVLPGPSVGQAAASLPPTVVLQPDALALVQVSKPSLGSNDKRRRLGRRDSDEQASRLVEEKLENRFCPEVIEGAVGKDCKQLARPYIKAALKLIMHEKDSSGKEQKVGTKFWTQFYEELPRICCVSS